MPHLPGAPPSSIRRRAFLAICPLVRLKDPYSTATLPIRMCRGSRVSFRWAGSIIAITTAIFLAATAFADTTDWSLSPGGFYTSSGRDGDLTGSNIPTLMVTGDGTPLKNGSSLAIIDGFLNFTSGAYDGTSSDWSWGAGGVLNLTGCIPGITATICTGSNNVTLLSDDFQSLQIQSVAGSLDAVFGDITGTLNTQVAAYFGVSTQFETASFTTAIVTIGNPGSGLIGTNLFGLIKADPPTAMPEHWSIVESLVFFVLVCLFLQALVRFRILRPVPVS